MIYKNLGTEPFFKNLTENLQISLPILTSSLEVYRMDSNLRDEVAKALAPASKIPVRNFSLFPFRCRSLDADIFFFWI